MAIFNLNFLLKVGQVEMCQNPSPISTGDRNNHMYTHEKVQWGNNLHDSYSGQEIGRCIIHVRTFSEKNPFYASTSLHIIDFDPDATCPVTCSD